MQTTQGDEVSKKFGYDEGLADEMDDALPGKGAWTSDDSGVGGWGGRPGDHYCTPVLFPTSIWGDRAPHAHTCTCAPKG